MPADLDPAATPMMWHRHIRALMDRDPDRAFVIAKQALRRHPQAVHLYWLRGQILAERGRFDEAEAVMEAGLAVDPFDPRCLLRLARIQVARGRIAAARSGIEAALNSPAPHWKSPQTAAELYEWMGDYAAADACLATVADTAPPELARRVATGLAADRQAGLPPERKRDYLAALEHLRTGDRAEAASAFDDLARRFQDYAPARFGLAGARGAAEVEGRRLSARGLTFDPREAFEVRPMDQALQLAASPAQLRSTPNAVLRLAPGGEVRTYAPSPALQGDGPSTSVASTAEPTFVAHLANAAVVGRGMLLTADGLFLDELNVVGSMTKYGARRDEGLVRFDLDEFRDGMIGPRMVERPAFLMAGPSDSCFGDWMINFAPRLALAEAAGLDDCAVVIGDETPAQMIALLEALGVGRERLIVHDSRGVTLFKELYAPSWPMHTRLHPMAGLFDVFQGVRAAAPGPRRIYLSRENLSGRPLADEAEIRRLFESKGFTALYPERMTLTEVVEAFSDAECIAGPYGSAWLHAGYCRKTPACLVLTPPSPQMFTQEVTVWLGALGFPFAYLQGVPAGAKGRWSVPLQAVEQLADRLCDASNDRGERA